MVSLVCSHFGSIGGVKDDGTSGLIYACCGAYECTRNKNIPIYIYILTSLARKHAYASRWIVCLDMKWHMKGYRNGQNYL